MVLCRCWYVNHKNGLYVNSVEHVARLPLCQRVVCLSRTKSSLTTQTDRLGMKVSRTMSIKCFFFLFELTFLGWYKSPPVTSNVIDCVEARCPSELYEPRHEISNNVVCATSKASDQPARTRSLITAFTSHLHII